MGFLAHRHRKIVAAFAVLVLMLTSTSLVGASAEPYHPHAYLSKRPSSDVSALRVYPTDRRVAESAHFDEGNLNCAAYLGGNRALGMACSTDGNEIDPGLKVVVRGEQGPVLYIGGSMGISGEVFFGDMPVAPDPYAAEPGDDSSGDEETGDAGNTGGDSGNIDGTDAESAEDSSGEESQEDDWDSYLPPKPHGMTLPSIRQNLNLVIDGRLGESVQAYTRLSMSGVWGVSRPSDASPWMPSMVRPLLVDEAWIRYATADFQVRAGKQRFSLGPIGLLGRTDLEAAEGVVLDTGAEKWGLTGVWSRLSSGYYYNSSFVTRADDLLAFRLARPVAETWALGLNYLASGLGDETGVSVDVLGNVKGRNIAAEVGMFQSSSTLYPEYQTSGWVPGFVLRAEAFNTPRHRLEVSYGYLSRGFSPYYSSIASRSGGLSVPFDQNTQGVAINYDRRLSPLTEVNLKVAHLRFLDMEAAHNEDSNGEEGSGSTEQNSMDQKDVTENGLDGNGAATLITQSATTPVFLGSASVRHELRTNIFAEGKYEHWWMESGSSYGRLTAGITVSF
jgi:hypothetical protein